jgi:glutamate/tyrosine decarboxylase-like PLP-dependent enzyme
MTQIDSSSISDPASVLPEVSQLRRAEEALHRSVPDVGLGLDAVKEHLTEDVAPALNASSQSSCYYGFVTGGATPAAVFADNMVTEYDQNVQVHLPNETIATDVEAAALDMICDLVDLDEGQWSHKTFTTGATAANIVGLACAREHVISTAAARRGPCPRGRVPTVSSHGLYATMSYAGIDEIQILTSTPHSSLKKAASIVGLGHASVKDVGNALLLPSRINLPELDRALQKSKTASIIAISCSEVNSGLFATYDEDMLAIRELADRYGAWIHVDAAFGLLARCLPRTHEYRYLNAGVRFLEAADSIAADAHKLFNVPYDCGIFLSRHLETGIDVFQNPGKCMRRGRILFHCRNIPLFPKEASWLCFQIVGAPYLSAEAGFVPSPLNIGIENSRRFRALPVYANLIALGRKGFVDMLESQIKLARAIAQFIDDSDVYELLPTKAHEDVPDYRTIYIIVLFRFKGSMSHWNADLVRRINSLGKIYVSGTTWNFEPACRFAISNWQSSVHKDFSVIKETLEAVARNID